MTMTPITVLITLIGCFLVVLGAYLYVDDEIA